MEPLGLVLLRTDHPMLSRCVGALRDLRRGATDAQRSEFGVGTPVWTISHPDGKRAYYSEGVITEWLPSSFRFKHSIPTMPGSAGMGFELLYGRCVWVRSVLSFVVFAYCMVRASRCCYSVFEWQHRRSARCSMRGCARGAVAGSDRSRIRAAHVEWSGLRPLALLNTPVICGVCNEGRSIFGASGW